jgi:hypothetical protein
MKVEEALNILKHHQQWRLGGIDNMPYEPKELTEAIDVLIRIVSNLLGKQKEYIDFISHTTDLEQFVNNTSFVESIANAKPKH